MNQLTSLTALMIKQMFKEDTPEIPDGKFPTGSEPAVVLEELRRLVAEKKINEAENLLFDHFDKQKFYYVRIGLEFYHSVSKLSEAELSEADFSLEEVGEGIKDMFDFYGIKIQINSSQASQAKQLANLTALLVKRLFKEDSARIDESKLPQTGEAFMLLDRIRHLVSDKKYVPAKNLIASISNPKNPIPLRIALEFYNTVCQNSEEDLKADGFPIDEVALGLTSLLETYGIKLQAKNQK